MIPSHFKSQYSVFLLKMKPKHEEPKPWKGRLTVLNWNVFFVLFRILSDTFWMHCSSLGYITQTWNLWNLFFMLQHAIPDYDWFSAHLFVSLGERSRGCPITDMQLQPTPYHAHLIFLILQLLKLISLMEITYYLFVQKEFAWLPRELYSSGFPCYYLLLLFKLK